MQVWKLLQQVAIDGRGCLIIVAGIQQGSQGQLVIQLASTQLLLPGCSGGGSGRAVERRGGALQLGGTMRQQAGLQGAVGALLRQHLGLDDAAIEMLVAVNPRRAVGLEADPPATACR